MYKSLFKFTNEWINEWMNDWMNDAKKQSIHQWINDMQKSMIEWRNQPMSFLYLSDVITRPICSFPGYILLPSSICRPETMQQGPLVSTVTFSGRVPRFLRFPVAAAAAAEDATEKHVQELKDGEDTGPQKYGNHHTYVTWNTNCISKSTTIAAPMSPET